MASIGMRHPVYAVISAETAGSAITYNNGAIAGKGIEANVDWNRADAALDADDVETLSDNSILGYNIRFGLAELSDTVRAAILGETATTSSTTEYNVEGVMAPFVGFGYIRVLQDVATKAIKYEGWWFHKVQFAINSEGAGTKKRSGVEYRTPEINGAGKGVYIDSSGKAKFAQHQVFTSESAAITWLHGKANFATSGSGSGSGTP